MAVHRSVGLLLGRDTTSGFRSPLRSSVSLSMTCGFPSKGVDSCMDPGFLESQSLLKTASECPAQDETTDIALTDNHLHRTLGG